MRILVTNDDGIHAPGIAALERIARRLSDDVWVVAPSDEQSGAGHSLTLTQPVRVREVSPRHFAVRFTPTDAVMIALGLILKDHAPDLILSGVNRGPNLGEDVTYSGTVSAAMEGTLAGVRSVALSQSTEERAVGEDAFVAAEQWGPRVLSGLLRADWPAGVLYNVNFPRPERGAIQGIKVTEQGFRDYGRVQLESRTDLRGFEYHWFGLGRETAEPGHETDLKAMREGYVSVTPLHLDMTHHASLGPLRAALAGV
ncbi:MAG: 5'/3'-nucleotidase SurE [Sphingomonadaceae bacterium]|nr:5'/3'-nucleotidase SurE [Sphingomonadaceae bacterium]